MILDSKHQSLRIAGQHCGCFKQAVPPQHLQGWYVICDASTPGGGHGMALLLGIHAIHP
jgi:hypothetical protein